jgi:hypothetical protein
MGGVVKAVTKIVKSVFKFVGNLFSGLFGWLSPSIPQYDNRSDYDSYAQGTYVNKQSNSAHIPVVYGRKRIGGTRVFVTSAGDNNKYLYVVMVIAEGECEKIEKVYIDDTEIQQVTSAGGLTHGSEFEVTSGKYAVGGSRLKLQAFYGKEDQAKASLLDGVSGWTSKHRLRGVCYIAARFEWRKATEDELKDQINNNPYQGMPTIQVLLKGKKVRKLTTLSEGEADAFSETYAQMVQSSDFGWSDNPAECLYDYLRNTRFGKGLDADSIDTTRFRTAANDCAQSKTFTRSDGTTTTKSFLTTNITLDTSKKMLDNTKALLECCRGYLPYTNGRYALKLEAAVSTSGLFAVDDHMIIGKISFSSNNKSNTYNRAEVSFSNQDEEYETDIRTYENATHLAEDENEVLEVKHTSPGITDPDRAYDQARLLVERSRKQSKIQFTGTAELQQLEAGDVIKFTHQYVFNPTTASDYMFDETLFRVVQVKVNADMTVGISAVEHDNSIYNVEVYQIPAQQNRNPKRFKTDYPTNIGSIIKPIIPPYGGIWRPVTPPTGDDLLVSPDFSYTLSVFDRPGIGSAGKGRVLINYSGLSTFVDQFKVFVDNGSIVTPAIFNCYHTSVEDLPITGDLEPGSYKITMTALGQGYELTMFENQIVNINPRGGGSSIVTASAAAEGFV